MPSLQGLRPSCSADPPRGREAGDRARRSRPSSVIGSPGYPFDEERLRRVAGRSYDRGHSAAGVAPPAARDHRLRRPHPGPAQASDVPATVIHGNRDPLVRPAGGRATASAIPGARLRMIEGMGHDLPRELWPDLRRGDRRHRRPRPLRGRAARLS